MMTDDEKNLLFEKHKRIIYYVTNRYKNMDTHIGESKAWGYLGFAEAVNAYQRKPEAKLVPLIFSKVRTQINTGARKHRITKNDISLQAKAFEGKDGQEKEL